MEIKESMLWMAKLADSPIDKSNGSLLEKLSFPSINKGTGSMVCYIDNNILVYLEP